MDGELKMQDASTLYARHTDEKGKSFVAEHRTWNRDGWIRIACAAALKVGGKSKVELIDKSQYNIEREKEKRRTA